MAVVKLELCYGLNFIVDLCWGLELTCNLPSQKVYSGEQGMGFDIFIMHSQYWNNVRKKENRLGYVGQSLPFM